MSTLQPVYISGTGHCSARGLSPAGAATAVLAGETAHDWRKTAGQRYPYFRMPLQEGAWLQRAEAAMHACVAGIRNRLSDGMWRQLPVFFASSSFQVGRHEPPLAAASAETANAKTAAELRALPFPPGAGSFARQCAQWLGLQAVPQCFSHACTSSSLALDAAASWLAHGWASHALVIATEYENQLTGNGFHCLGLLSPDACRPFAVNRSGLVLGEAVAAVLLSAGQALASNRVDATSWLLSACASGTDTYSLTSPDPEGKPIAAVIAAALQRAQLQAADIGLVKLHAAGVDNTDMAEARALRHVFGDRLPPLLSLKPYLGHTLGASALTEITALLACLDQGQMPATPGCERPDPKLGMQPVRARQPCAARHVLLINLGFGGSITASILSRRGA